MNGRENPNDTQSSLWRFYIGIIENLYESLLHSTREKKRKEKRIKVSNPRQARYVHRYMKDVVMLDCVYTVHCACVCVSVCVPMLHAFSFSYHWTWIHVTNKWTDMVLKNTMEKSPSTTSMKRERIASILCRGHIKRKRETVKSRILVDVWVCMCVMYPVLHHVCDNFFLASWRNNNAPPFNWNIGSNGKTPFAQTQTMPNDSKTFMPCNWKLASLQVALKRNHHCSLHFAHSPSQSSTSHYVRVCRLDCVCI